MSGYVTKYGTWRFLCKASPFPEFQAKGWLCCRLCHLVFPCRVGPFPEFQAKGCVAGCVTWLFAGRVGLFSEIQAKGCVAGCVTWLFACRVGLFSEIQANGRVADCVTCCLPVEWIRFQLCSYVANCGISRLFPHRVGPYPKALGVFRS